jgi:hypothetical protein
MGHSLGSSLPAGFVSELEKKYFWWETVGGVPRSTERILAQAMDLASFADIRRLETVAGPERLADVMVQAQPGWLSGRSWELWRGRLALATGRALPQQPPRRSLHAAAL